MNPPLSLFFQCLGDRLLLFFSRAYEAQDEARDEAQDEAQDGQNELAKMAKMRPKMDVYIYMFVFVCMYIYIDDSLHF